MTERPSPPAGEGRQQLLSAPPAPEEGAPEEAASEEKVEKKDARIQLLEDTWLLTIFTVLLATALPWFVSAFDIEFGPASWGIFALGVLYVSLAALAQLTGGSVQGRRHALTVVQALGVIVIGFVWQHAGALQNPAFLLAFVLPVIGASFISRWQPYGMAALGVLVVGLICLSQVPELRWYVSGLGAAGAWVAGFFDGGFLGRSSIRAPFPGFYAPFGYSVVLLEVFAVLLFAAAAAAEYLGTMFERLRAQLGAARGEAQQAQELWTTLIQQFPGATLLVDADTLQVVCASEELQSRFAGGQAAAGRGLFEALHFSYPEVVQQLIAGRGGLARPGMIRLADRLVAAEVRVRHLGQDGRRLALMIVEDVSELFWAQLALDADDHAAVVVNPRGRVVSLNQAARGLFADAKPGMEISRLLVHPGLGPRWWESGLTGQRRMQVQMLQQFYQLTLSSVQVPGEDERVTVIAFLPAGKAAAGESAATSSTQNKALVHSR